MSEHCVALLGRADQPTDAVEEYCQYLSEALREHNFDFELVRVNWPEKGWRASLSDFQQKAGKWRGQWVFLQYTALAWSRRGFPFNFLRVIRALREAGARVGVVYHDGDPEKGRRWIDKLRRAAQLRTMRRALLASELAVLTVPPQQLAWLASNQQRTVFIPVGANLPANAPIKSRQPGSAPAIAVFGVTGGEAGDRETEMIIEAVRLTAKQVGHLKLQVLGRHAELRETRLREGLRDWPVQLDVTGVIPAAEVTCRLCASDVLLFLRGPISSRRGSAIAGIACGLPVIAYAGPETAAPITEAGVMLVSPANAQEFAKALTRVLVDKPHHDALAARSQAAYQKHFSWPAIAARYAEALRQHS
jgi:glycosyltransferase involved in cell wall biosynthesis